MYVCMGLFVQLCLCTFALVANAAAASAPAAAVAADVCVYVCLGAAYL